MGVARAVLYTRVSGRAQELDGASLETQLAGCRQYAQERVYSVVGHFTDTHTGAEYRERRGLSELRALVRAGAVDVVIAWAIDRLSRHQAHLAIIAEECLDNGARLEFVTEDFEDSAVGRFIRSARAFAAEIEREKITERSMRGKLARLASGRLLIPRVPPYGLAPNAERTGYVAVDALAPVVRRIYDAYDAGDSIRSIALALMADGIPTATGLSRWSSGAIAQLLKHPAYCGRATGLLWDGKARRRDTAQNIVMPPGASPEIVSVAQWERVQRRLARSAEERAGAVTRPNDTLLRGGYARCGYCGRRMSVKWWDGRPYYSCTARDDPSGTCLERATMSANRLDGQVWARVEALLSGVADIGALVPERGATDRLASVDALLAQLERDRARVMRELMQTDDAELAALWRAQLTEISARRRDAEATRVEALSGVVRAQHTQDRIRQARDLLGDSRETATRRAALAMLNVRVNVYRLRRQPRWELVYVPAERH